MIVQWYAMSTCHQKWVTLFRDGAVFVAGGGILSVMYIALFHKLGYISASAVNMMPVIWITTLLATVVEALPVYHTLDDNLTVPVVAATVGQFLMYGLRCLK